MLCCCCKELTCSINWPRSTSIVNRASWSAFCNCGHWFLTYGSTIWYSCVWLKYLGFTMSENESKISDFRSLWAFFLHIWTWLKKIVWKCQWYFFFIKWSYDGNCSWIPFRQCKVHYWDIFQWGLI